MTKVSTINPCYNISKYMKEKKPGLIEGISLENFIDHYTDMIDSEVRKLENYNNFKKKQVNDDLVL